jgi:hypothetical protein
MVASKPLPQALPRVGDYKLMWMPLATLAGSECLEPVTAQGGPARLAACCLRLRRATRTGGIWLP